MGDKMLTLHLARLRQERLLDEVLGKPDRVRERLLESAQVEVKRMGNRRLDALNTIGWQAFLKLGDAAAAVVPAGLI